MKLPGSVLATARGRASIVSCALLVSFVLAPGAWAQSGGSPPLVDPESPAGTEYELPVERARQDALGGGTSDTPAHSGQRHTPLFGEGIEPNQRDSARGGSSGTDASGGGSADATGDRSRQPDPGLRTRRGQASPPAGDGATIIAVGAGAIGLLLFGGLIGLFWRTR